MYNTIRGEVNHSVNMDKQDSSRESCLGRVYQRRPQCQYLALVRLLQVLAEFPTSTREDKKNLQDLDAKGTFYNRCLWHVLQWRIQQKQALARAYKHAAACTARLGGS